MAKKEFTFRARGATVGNESGSLIHYRPGQTRVLPENELDHVNDAHYETRPLTPRSDASDQTVSATTAARELAEEEGVDLSSLGGTGVDGKVLKGDVKDAVE